MASGANEVRVVVTASNETAAGFDAAKAGADTTAASFDGLAAAQDKVTAAGVRYAQAQGDLLDAQLKLQGVQDKEGATDAEIAAAKDKVTAATIRQADAQVKLLQAEQEAEGAAAKAADAEVAASGRAAAASKAAGDEALAAGGKAAEGGGLLAGIGSKLQMAGVGVAIGMGAAVDAASKFQDSTTHLVTDAGESAKNLALVQQGILAVSAATGTSANDINNAMYHIESGGMHGASGLAVLKVAAEGAKVGGADLDTVSKTLVGTLNAYGMTSSNSAKQTQMATSMMNQLIATVGAGDMRMQDLASSLSSVAPLAAAAGIDFSEVGGAIATMTAQGMSAQQATQDLSNTIRNLSSPNQVAIKEMQAMGLNSNEVSKQLGSQGLTGTLDILTTAITRHMGPSGMILQSSFQASKQAAADAQQEIKAMPASLQALAEKFLAGSVTSKQWTADLKGLDPVSAHLMTQFAGTAEKAHSFNSLLAGGSPAAQTYTAALAKMTGGATGLNTALMLTGGRLNTFIANQEGVYKAGQAAGDSVANWATIQGTLAFKTEQAKASIQGMGISLGMALLPAVTAVLGPIAEFLSKIAANKTEAEAFAGVVGSLLAGALGVKLVGALKTTAGAIKSVGDGIGWVVGKFAGMGAAAEGEAAVEDEAAASTSGSWVAASAAKAAAGVAWVAQSVAKVAVVVASNVAGALATAAAWVAANAVMLLGIGAVVALIVVAVVEIVKHWGTIVKGVEDVWHTIYDFCSKIVSDIVDFIKTHWQLLVAILTGPIGLAVLAIKDHFSQISSGASKLIDDVTGFFRSLPSRILSALGDLGSLLFGAGERIIQGLINGVTSMIGSVTSTISNVVSTIKSFLPFSPAKQGPLSGSGAPENSGRSIMTLLAQGITAGSDQPAAAMHAAAAKLARGTGPGAGLAGAAAAGGGQAVLVIQPGAGGSGLEQQFWTWLKNGVRNQGGDPSMFTRKVAFA